MANFLLVALESLPFNLWQYLCPCIPYLLCPPQIQVSNQAVNIQKTTSFLHLSCWVKSFWFIEDLQMMILLIKFALWQFHTHIEYSLIALSFHSLLPPSHACPVALLICSFPRLMTFGFVSSPTEFKQGHFCDCRIGTEYWNLVGSLMDTQLKKHVLPESFCSKYFGCERGDLLNLSSIHGCFSTGVFLADMYYLRIRIQIIMCMSC